MLLSDITLFFQDSQIPENLQKSTKKTAPPQEQPKDNNKKRTANRLHDDDDDRTGLPSWRPLTFPIQNW